jgi:hypothetical protein
VPIVARVFQQPLITATLSPRRISNAANEYWIKRELGHMFAIRRREINTAESNMYFTVATHELLHILLGVRVQKGETDDMKRYGGLQTIFSEVLSTTRPRPLDRERRGIGVNRPQVMIGGAAEFTKDYYRATLAFEYFVASYDNKIHNYYESSIVPFLLWQSLDIENK